MKTGTKIIEVDFIIKDQSFQSDLTIEAHYKIDTEAGLIENVILKNHITGEKIKEPLKTAIENTLKEYFEDSGNCVEENISK